MADYDVLVVGAGNAALAAAVSAREQGARAAGV
jgi:tricarballylate dehydrogenase